MHSKECCRILREETKFASWFGNTKKGRKKKMYVPVPLENTTTKDVTAEEEERVSSGSSKVSCIAPPILIKDSRRKRKKYPSKRLRQKKWQLRKRDSVRRKLVALRILLKKRFVTWRILILIKKPKKNKNEIKNV